VTVGSGIGDWRILQRQGLTLAGVWPIENLTLTPRGSVAVVLGGNLARQVGTG
jgi:hypothetical protein